MHDKFQLVFAGEILSGYTAGVVREALAQRLRLDDERLERMFSGERVVLKRGVELDRALHYVSQFELLGALLHIEDSPPPAPPKAAPPAAPAPIRMRAPPATPPAPPVPAPAQGHELPTLLNALAPHEAAPPETADAPQAAFPPEARRLRDEPLATTPAPAPPQVPVPMPAPRPASAAPRLLGWRLQGRLGRQPYAVASSLALCAMVLVATAMLRQPTPGRLALGGWALLLLSALSLRWTVLRCHDVDRSGAWAALVALPVVGTVASLALAVWPGSEEDNAHGAATGPGNVWLVLAAVAVAAMVAGAAGPGLLPWPPDAHADDAPAAADAPHLLPPDAARAFDAEYAPAAGHKAFARSRGGGWGWKAGAASRADAVAAAVATCEANRAPAAPACEAVHVDDRWLRTE